MDPTWLYTAKNEKDEDPLAMVHDIEEGRNNERVHVFSIVNITLMNQHDHVVPSQVGFWNTRELDWILQSLLIDILRTIINSMW